MAVCPVPDPCFSPFERMRHAEQYGIEGFPRLTPAEEESLVARAISKRSIDETFHEAVDYFSRNLDRAEPRLLAHYFSLPERARRSGSNVLVAHYSNRRARAEFLALARRAVGTKFWGFAWTFASIGGGAPVRALLRTRLGECARQLDARSTLRARTSWAETCATICAALLLLDPDADDAARTLVHLFRERSRYDETSNVVAFMREVVTRQPMTRTPAIRTVIDALCELLSPDADPDDFALASPVFEFFSRSRAARRALELLSHDQWIIRGQCAYLLSRLDRHAIALRQYVATHPEDYCSVDIARRLPGLSPDKQLPIAEHALKDRSPYSRLKAALFLQTIAGHAAAALAGQALQSEREALVKVVLQRRADSGARAVDG